MFNILQEINHRPDPFEYYTAEDLWTDEHTSRQMLSYHLNAEVDLSSRKEGFIERSVSWMAPHFQIKQGTRILDFGCGPGLYAARLAKLGAKVIGVDFSRTSIEYASKVAADEQLDIQYVHQNYLDFETADRFDIALMIMCDLCALSPAQRRKMLARFHHLLVSGGTVLLDVYSLDAFEQRDENVIYGLNLLDGFWSDQDYYVFQNTFKYEEEKVVLDKYTIVEADRTRTVYNWLQYFSRESLQKEFEQAGFAVHSMYADVAGTPYNGSTDEFAVVAVKQ